MEPSRPKHILQRNKSDCAIAAVAQVTGKTYGRIKKICGPNRGGLDSHEILWLLSHFGSWRQTIPRKNYTLREWKKKHPTCVVSIGYMFDVAGHALSIVDGVVYCPSGNPADEDRLVSDAFIPIQEL